MKKILSLLFVFVGISMAAFAKTDKFDVFTVSPADGSSITDAQFRNVVLTFPNVEKMKFGSNNFYKIYTESEWNKVDEWGMHIGNSFGGTYLDYDGVCDIDGNTATIHVKEELPESGKYVLEIAYNSFREVDDMFSYNNDEIIIKYTIEKKGLEYTLNPSNAAPVSMVDLWPVTVTFTGATKVTLKDEFMDRATVKLLDPNGNELTSYEARSSSDSHWSVDGNSTTVRFYESIRKDFVTEGEYTLVFTNGSIILDGAPQNEIRIKYNVTLPERPAEGPAALNFTDYIDEDDKLYFSIPEGFRTTGYSFAGNSFYDSNGNEAGRMDNIQAVNDEQTEWYITMKFFGEKNPEMTYTIDIDENLIHLEDVYTVEHPSAATKLTFYGSKHVSGISESATPATKPSYYTFGGVKVKSPVPGKAYIIKSGNKTRAAVVGK